MKKMFALLLAVLLLSGCVAKPRQTETTVPETASAESTAATEHTFVTIPEQVVTPGEMPRPPEGDVQLPPQPGLDIETQ